MVRMDRQIEQCNKGQRIDVFIIDTGYMTEVSWWKGKMTALQEIILRWLDIHAEGN